MNAASRLVPVGTERVRTLQETSGVTALRDTTLMQSCACAWVRTWLAALGVVKEEIQNRFNLISEERVKYFEQNSENLMKIGWKIRKLWHFEVSQIFKKHFLTSHYEYANEWVDDVIASQFSIHFVHRNDKKFHIFSYENVRLALTPLWIDAELC